MSKYAALFRNLNLGRRHCPDKALFEQAFAEAGAQRPASFQVNGSLVFEARGDAAARRIVAGARERLHAACGLAEPAFLRRVEALRALVDAQPFAGLDPADEIYDRCICFLSQATPPPDPATLPWRSPRGDAEIIAYSAAAHAALGLSRKLGASPGSPNALLERRLGAPSTMRNWGTLNRLVDRHG
ncbi:DUF1697 domain-containing protein [Roseateles violae]|uniref:DUF1697 domain-containing protein n=1 Tax=Roseateles violae TaxID=3058042 RepID=A0ABT8DLF0_9BURK|nr:DUF1697 domain-containing protein [Pelomonas sp. PFR6]MDN3919241.1 DUF1697 domain-containing protein [Pelomonas sp. PFR6]